MKSISDKEKKMCLGKIRHKSLLAAEYNLDQLFKTKKKGRSSAQRQQQRLLLSFLSSASSSSWNVHGRPAFLLGQRCAVIRLGARLLLHVLGHAGLEVGRRTKLFHSTLGTERIPGLADLPAMGDEQMRKDHPIFPGHNRY